MKAWMVMVLLVACGGSSSGDDDGDDTTVTIVAPSAPSALIAYRAGTGPWTVTSGAMSPVTFPAAGRYSVAITCPSTQAGVGSVTAFELTVGEVPTLTYDGGCTHAGAKLSGAILGGSTNGFLVQWGAAHYRNSGSGTSYATTVQPGTHDLVASRGDIISDRVLVMRDFAITGDVTQDLDFTNAAMPASSPVTVPGPTRPFVSLTSTFTTAGGTSMFLGVSDTSLRTLPASLLQPGDLYTFEVGDQSGSAGTVFVASTRHVGHDVPATLELPTGGSPSPSVQIVAAGGVARPHVVWEPNPAATSYAFLANNWTLVASPEAFADGAIDFPDMTDAAGWDPSVAILANATVDWTVLASSGASLDDAQRAIPTHAYELHTAGWSGESR